MNIIQHLGTCKASWFDSITNRTSDSRLDSYWWTDSKFSNRPRCHWIGLDCAVFYVPSNTV